ncbi:hypothetical protein GE061_012560 [Apolygus lucorum]|uniref:Uncharacterized protein n=1 Tax=Apolygus lucorum TaxID=248454 RepID=A0A8S9XSM8_APOLU|nr:hypothetical protein GE061_012560 [Apolygus lucorum]
MYGDIDGLEFIPGILLEAPKQGNVLGDTATAMISDLIFKAAVTHPLTTTSYLRKTSFGGIQGWEVVKNANINSLICQNVNDGCCKDVLTFEMRNCKDESLCGKKKIREKVAKSVPKKIIGISDQVCSLKIQEEVPESVVADVPPSPTLCEKIEAPCQQVQKQRCPFKRQVKKRPCNKPEPKPVCQVPVERPCQQEANKRCEKIKPPEVKRVKKCCNRRPWFRTKK